MKPQKVKLDAHLWARDPNDFYVEPAWVSEALFKRVEFVGTICDPACGMGRILQSAKKFGYRTRGQDIVNRGADAISDSFAVKDFMKKPQVVMDNIVCNPPYKYDEVFLLRALEVANKKVALLLRAQWANAQKRSRLLERLPLSHVLMITPRPSMPPGRVVKALKGKDPSGGRVDYAWFVFEHGFKGSPAFGWARRGDH